MATIDCAFHDFERMALEFLAETDEASAEQVAAGLKCLALAFVGLQCDEDERYKALRLLRRAEVRAQDAGLEADRCEHGRVMTLALAHDGLFCL